MSRTVLTVGLVLAVTTFFAPTAQAREPIERPPDTTRNRMLLADTLGAVHYLTIVCSGRGDQGWRNRMGELLQLELISAYERDDLVAAFNHGFRQEKYYFPRCTAGTAQDITVQKKHLAKQGKLLSAALADPYLR